jgi:hypothetical protein
LEIIWLFIEYSDDLTLLSDFLDFSLGVLIDDISRRRVDGFWISEQI